MKSITLSRKKAILSLTAVTVLMLSLAVIFVIVPVFAVPPTDMTDVEMDGNIVHNVSTDWADLFNGSGVPNPLFAPFTATAWSDDQPTPDTSYFGQGKDIDPISSWTCINQSNPADKEDILHSYAALAIPVNGSHAGHRVLYIGLERFSNGGTASLGFWLLKDGTVSCPASSTFTGAHQDGDVLLASEFTGGGSVSSIIAYGWNGGANGSLNGTPIATGADCSTTNNSNLCAKVNNVSITTPWPTQAKPSEDPANTLSANKFFEAAVDLDAILPAASQCFTGVLGTTRSSAGTTADIKDFTRLGLNTCGTLTIIKDAVPNSAQDFNFTTTGGLSPPTFSLDDDSDPTLPNNITFTNLAAGNYSVSEGVVSGWTQTSATCSDGSPVSAISIQAGEKVTCIFNNTLQQGNIKIIKNTAGGDGTFSFTVAGPSPSVQNVTTSGGTGNTSLIVVTPGTYNTSETTIPAGWDLTASSCSSGTPGNFTVPAGGTVTCTFNNTKRGHLIVQKTTNPSGDTTVFNISASGTGTITGGGLGTVTDVLDKNYEVTPGNYSVAETIPSGWDKTGDTCQGVVVNAGQNATCLLTNTKRGTIIVEKQTNPDGVAGSFIFTGNASGSIGDNGQITVSNLTPGTYTSTESDPTPAFDLTSISCDDGSSATPSTFNLTTRTATFKLDAGETVKCTFTNTKRAFLTVIKHAVNDNGGTAVAANFTLHVKNSADVAGSPAVGSETGTTYTLVPGTYTVNEDAPLTGYAQTSITGNCLSNGTITLAAGDNKTCTINNNDNAPSLTLNKIVVNNNGGTAAESAWNLTATGPTTISGPGAAGSADVMSSPAFSAGTYNLSESSGPLGYSTSSWSCVGGAQSGNQITLGLGQSANCTITNDDDPAHLIVIKHVINDNGGTLIASNFSMHISGTAGSATFAGSESGMNTTVNAGNYSVSEDTVAGYASSTSGSCSGTIANGETKTCTITNDDISPQLIVIKHVVNDNGGTAVASNFTMSVTGTNVQPSSSFSGAESPGTNVTLNAGAYSVGETGPVGYTQSKSVDCSGSVALNETKTCTITNDDDAAHLIVIKHVVNNNGGTKTAADFNITVTGSSPSPANFLGSESGTNVTINAGAYSADEVLVSGYEKNLSANCSGTIANGETKTCTITNDDLPAHLIVIKHVVNDNGGAATASNFTMTINGVTVPSGASFAGSEAGTDKVVNPGTYNVSETGPSGYAQNNSVGCSGTISLGETKTCTVTNDDQPAKIILNKNVINNNGGTAGPNDFGLKINGTSVLSGSTTQVNSNTAHTINESGLFGYSFVSITGDAKCPSVLGGSVTLNEGETVNCTITNDDIQPKLIVIKNVINDNGGKAVVSNFSINVSGNSASPSSFAGAASPGTIVMLNAGLYNVSEDAFAGYVSSFSSQCLGNISVGETRNCNVTNDDQPGNINGLKFNDLNGNGVQDAGEPTLSGWTIFLDTNDNGVLDGGELSTVTAANGSYSFIGINASTYNVREVVQAGWMQTAPAGGKYVVILASGASVGGKDFGNFKLGSISGTKFEDDNGNGVKDTGDLGLANWTVNLFGFDTITNQTVNLSILTGNGGNFTFVNLTNGTYTLTENLKSGWIQTLSPTAINVQSGTNSTGNNFGNFQLGRISGDKFNDVNGNGVQNTGELGLANWTIVLTYPNGTIVTQLTDNVGHYIFRNLTAGNYNVSEILQDGWIQTKPTGDGMYHILMHSSGFFTQKDFGNFKLGKISGIKFNDTNGNGAKDQGEIGLSGWTIRLYGFDTITSTTVNISTVTDSSGNFVFENLTNGTYTLTEDLQIGWLQTLMPSAVNVQSGTNSTVNNFGNFKLGQISGAKFDDTNGNGVKDQGEPGLANWTINLFGFDTITQQVVNTSTLTDVNGNYAFVNLTNGTYTLTEALKTGWIQTLAPGAVNVQSGTVSTNNNFGNFKLAEIIVHKNVLNPDGGEVNDSHQFTSNLNGGSPQTIAEGTDATYGGLSPGNYNITENSDSDYDLVSITPSSVMPASGSTTDVFVVNKQKKATLIITKNVLNPDGGEVNDNHSFTVRLDGSDPQTVSEILNASYLVNPGTHTITEDSDANYDLVSITPDEDGVTPGAQVTVISNGQATLNVVNKQKKATIIVVKNVVGIDGVADVVDDHGFSVTLNSETKPFKESSSATFTVNPGTYGAVEDADSDYVLVSNDGPATVGSNGNATITIVNKQKPVEIHGMKFNDVNENGNKDGGDNGLENWTIYLDANDNDVLDGSESSTTTDVNGLYSFTGLSPETYHVREVQQDGWVQTAPDGGEYNVTLLSNQVSNDNDFGNFKLGKISGFKFNDLNGNGVWDNGEPALSNWTINMAGTAAGSTTTDVNGYYEFTGLHAGAYTVTEEAQAGWVQTTTGPAAVNVVSGTDSQDNNFGNFRTITISGQKFNDLNGNGIKDNGEPGLEDWQIELNGGSPTLTDSNGNYQFTGLGPGSYTVTELQQAGWIQTTANPTLITAVSGQDVTGVDFGNFQRITISGFKFDDTNGNGVWNNGEPALQNWTINLNGTQSTATDSNGAYLFGGLGPGVYIVNETQQAGWIQTTSDPAPILAVSGQNIQDVNFGNFKLGKISGYKFDDTNGNGVWDNGEPALSNWTINLTGTDAGSTTTDVNGYYEFTGLNAGTHAVTETQQNGWTQTTSDPAPINVVSGTDSQHNDFGNFHKITITVHKNVLAPDGVTDISNGHVFTVKNNGTNPKNVAEGSNAVYSGLGPGTYTITENIDAGYILVSITPPSVVAMSGTNADIYVVNKLKPIHPQIVTQASSSSINIGDSITDTVTITGQIGIPLTGSVTFYVCSGTTCTSGGTNLGTVTVGTNNGSVTVVSSPFTPSSGGTYTFRAEYSGDANYLSAVDSNTNGKETFTVAQVTTRTQGFWKNHVTFTTSIFNNQLGGSVLIGNGASHKGPVDSTAKVFGAFQSNVAKTSSGAKRNSVDQARVQLLHQLLTAKLNCAAFGCSSSVQTLITNADTAYAAGNITGMLNYAGQLDTYNNSGDAQAIPSSLGPVGSASPKTSSSIADTTFWNAP